jgi:hypothetical protein
MGSTDNLDCCRIRLVGKAEASSAGEQLAKSFTGSAGDAAAWERSNRQMFVLLKLST